MSATLLLRSNAPSLQQRLFETRRRTLALAAPLSPEDMTAQAMADASPTKWHLAHTSWFFEALLLGPHVPGYRLFDEAYHYLFNSYYESLGPRHARPKRGLLTRPSCTEIFNYRDHVDEALAGLFARGVGAEAAGLIELGVNHEEQHQELMLTDILALFAQNPLHPAYRETPAPTRTDAPQPPNWIDFRGGLVGVGHDGDGFCYDNETPAHQTFLAPFRLSDRLVTNAEWLEFMSDGGYTRPTLWLSDGFVTCAQEDWRAPLYWERRDDAWLTMTLGGLRPLEPAAPVTHVSYYEADAFARWAGNRLPTEYEWEHAAKSVAVEGTVGDALAPQPAPPRAGAMRQMFGDVWEWTQSAYLPYPGYDPAPGALGEYNGKFMINQMVLRGGSCATPRRHMRATYRNFFYPHQRWQFTGLRLASGVD